MNYGWKYWQQNKGQYKLNHKDIKIQLIFELEKRNALLIKALQTL